MSIRTRGISFGDLMTPKTPDTRAQILEQKSYLRPTNEDGTEFETFKQSVDRQIDHQIWLWERAKAGIKKDSQGDWLKDPLDLKQQEEIEELRRILYDRRGNLAGRTRWLGGTDISKKVEATQFNCAFNKIRTISDMVDTLWLLMQGCGVGFTPVTGTLKGYENPLEVKVVRSTREEKGGQELTAESYLADGTWILTIGDSAEAWVKGLGKLLRGPKKKSTRLILDLSNIRPAGTRLAGYGWICSGDTMIAESFKEIADILSKRGPYNLTSMDILDAVNWLGRILSSRRSAQICLVASTDKEAEELAKAKKDFWIENPQRAQSNNSISYLEKPTMKQLREHFGIMVECGGSEPGIINSGQARKRAPYFQGINPCAEILLKDGGFCNLVETVLSRYNGEEEQLIHDHGILARANYRQTCVYLRDGILQEKWHKNNEELRLCGVGVTGVMGWENYNSKEHWAELRYTAKVSSYAMAHELGLNYPALVTTIKPSGTMSKTMCLPDHAISEGIHKPSSKFIFNNVQFCRTDPVVATLDKANYTVMDHPSDSTAVVVSLPVDFSDLPCWEEGEEYNMEPAVEQLERYKMTMNHYTDHNSSITVSYDPEEIPAIIDWMYVNWDSFVGVSFLLRLDPTKSAAELGYQYLPQESVTEERYRQYVSKLLPVDLSFGSVFEEADAGSECVGGVCPIR